jgi:multidrug efflux pump subunit AcrB
MGRLTRFAVERWQFTLVAFALLTALGISSLLSISRAEDPHFPLPIYIVRVVCRGRSRRTWNSWWRSRSRRR